MEQQGTPASGEEDLVFAFLLATGNGSEEVIKIYPKDVENLRCVVKSSQLDQVSLETIRDVFAKASEATNGFLNKAAFEDCVEELIPTVSSLSEQYRAFLNFAMSNIFLAYDRHQTGYVRALECACGFGLFATGSKSDKLSVTFDWFDEDDTGFISKTDLCHYLRSFLTLILALNNNALTLDVTKVQGLIEDGTVAISNKVFDAETGVAEHANAVSFESFKNWYNNGGYRHVPWLELLDLKKWELTGTTATKAHSNDEDYLVFEFKLSEQGNVLQIQQQDIDDLGMILAKTQLHDTEVEDMMNVFQAASDDGQFNKQGFDEAIRAMVPGEGLSAEDKEFLSLALSNIFFAFDRNGSGVVDLAEFASGFSVLGAGSKSDKLALAFQLFDGDGDGYLTRRELWKYLRSFLVMLLKLSAHSESGHEALNDVANDGAVACSRMVFAQSDLEHKNKVSFEEFAAWYTDGGYTLAPWLELLDLRKWVSSAQGASEAAATSANSSIIYQFDMSDEDGDVLQIQQQDIDDLSMILAKTQLHTTDADDMMNVFQAVSEEGRLDKQCFDEAIRAMVPGEGLSAEDKEFLSLALSNIFFAFDRNGSGVVDLAEFASGFSVLGAGSKSDKLALAFQLFDGDDDGYLSCDELAMYLRAFLTMLFAMTMHASTMPAEQIYSVIDERATDVADYISSSCDGGMVDFETFGEWYNSGGNEIIPWVELLDLKKWPFDTSAASAASAVSGNANSDNVVLEFAMRTGEDEGDVLQIQQRHIEILSMILAKTQLHTQEVEDVMNVFMAVADEEGRLDKQCFDEAIRAMVPGEGLSAEDKEFLSLALSNIFFAFDRNGSGVVDLAEFASGFSVLGAGSKSDKLALAFQLFDGDDDGYLSCDELAMYLRAFLTMLFALSMENSETFSDYVYAVIDERATDVADYISSSCDGGMVDFETFGEWYNSGGNEIIPWVELLDLKKWPFDTSAASAASAAAPASTTEVAEAPDSVVLEFKLSDEDGDILQIQQQDIDDLSMILAKTQLHDTEVEDMMNVFQAASDDGQFNKQCFDEAIRAMVPGEGLSAEDREFLSLALSNIFFAFDRNGSGVVDLAEFASGFSVLGAGSKSDKLALAFQLFDGDGDGYLTRRELWKYLRSFLIMLLKMSTHSEAESEIVTDFANDGAVACARMVFMQTKLEHKNKVSFEEFAAWYTDGGYTLAPWLELLDLRKWVSSAQGASEAAATSANSSIIYQFDMSDEDGDVLQIQQQDIDDLSMILAKTQLHTTDAEDMMNVFQAVSEEGRLDKQCFDEAIRAMVPGEGLSAEDKEFLSLALSNIFFAFDRNGSGVVDLAEFASGFSVLGAGSKSDKLALAFQLFDGDDDGYLSCDELAMYLRAFLTMLFAMTMHASTMPAEQIYSVIDERATDVADYISSSCDGGMVDFETFGEWYNSGGNEITPWVELLDLKNWRLETSKAATAAADSAADEDPVVLEFALSNQEGDVLRIQQQDIDDLSMILAKTQLHNMEVEDMMNVFQAASDDGQFNKQGFDEAIRAMVPGEGLSAEDKEFLALALSNIFFAFDRNGSGVVDLAEFASGFSVLGAGSKSDKLALAFQLFDGDGDGYLTRRELWKYLRSFLIMLLKMSTHSDAEAEEIADGANDGAVACSRMVFAQSELEHKSKVSFEEFAAWYTNGGYTLAPWLELLDIRKWPAGR